MNYSLHTPPLLAGDSLDQIYEEVEEIQCHEINSHEINSHEINYREINSHKINFSQDQFPYDQPNIASCSLQYI